MNSRFRYYENRQNNRQRSNFKWKNVGIPNRNKNQQVKLENYQIPGQKAVINPKDYQNEIVLSISIGQGLIGAAIYDQSEQIAQILNDMSENDNFSNTRKLIQSVKPTTILANSSQDLRFINFLIEKYTNTEIVEDFSKASTSFETTAETTEKWDSTKNVYEEENSSEEEVDDSEGEDEEEENEFENIKIIKLSNHYFKFKTSVNRINELLNSDNSSISTEDQQIITKMRFNLDNVNMIKSFGALLHYLDDVRLGVESEPLGTQPVVKSIKTIVLEQHVEIDFNSYLALNIMPKETENKNPCAEKSSLFEYMNRCRSTIGRRCLRNWFLNPTAHRATLVSRQKCVAFFMQDCNLDLTRKMLKSLNNVKGLMHIFKRFQSGTAQLMHWDGFVQTVISMCEIIETIKMTPLKNELIEGDMCIKDISDIIVVVKSIVDFEESRNEERISVCHGVDEFLDECKFTYRTLPTILTAIAEQEGIRLGIEKDEKCSCSYVPLIGYLLSLPNNFPVSQHPEMTVVFKTDSEIRVKNEMTQKLEEEVGDVRMQIIDKETDIILRLKTIILKKKRKLERFLDVVGQIDALISMSMVSAEMNWCCPLLVDEPVLEATKVWHPLAAMITKKEFVANNLESGVKKKAKVNIITGPNACGKSVYMKQVGILAFLAHIGCFVPAKQAKIGLIDRIVTRMFTVDSVLDGMSTFARDVEQVALALRKGTVNSLVIIDEFGKGTMTEVGLSLLASCLKYWIERGSENCPHLLISSHFHSLPKYIPIDNDLVKFLTFRVERQNGGKMKYCFKLIEGIVDCSFAMSIAKDEKIPLSIIGRACQIYNQLHAGKPLWKIETKLKKCEFDEEEAVKKAEALISSKNFLGDVEKLTIEQMKIEHRKKSQKTLADFDLVGDTQGIDTDQWDVTQNLIEEEEEEVEDEDEEEEEKEDEAALKTEKWVAENSNKMGERSVLKRDHPTKKMMNGHLSVSFAVNNTWLDEILPPSKKIGLEIEKREKVEKTPPSPILFSSDEEDNNIENQKTSLLTPLMKRMSSNEERNCENFMTPNVKRTKKKLDFTLNTSILSDFSRKSETKFVDEDYLINKSYSKDVEFLQTPKLSVTRNQIQVLSKTPTLNNNNDETVMMFSKRSEQLEKNEFEEGVKRNENILLQSPAFRAMLFDEMPKKLMNSESRYLTTPVMNSETEAQVSPLFSSQEYEECCQREASEIMDFDKKNAEDSQSTGPIFDEADEKEKTEGFDIFENDKQILEKEAADHEMFYEQFFDSN